MAQSQWYVVASTTFLLLCASLFSASGQEKGPQGESFVREFTTPPDDNHEVSCKSKHLTIRSFIDNVPVRKWDPPKGRDIIYVDSKTDNSEVLFILLDDGTIYETEFTREFGWDMPRVRSKADPKDQFQTFRKIVGDALYTLSTLAVYVSRDAASTWKVDTAGVGGGTYYDLALDTAEYPYLAHSSGLWKQHPDSNVWRKVTAYPRTIATTVFVDRRNSIFSGTFQQVYVSTNNGSTWVIDTVGLGNQTVTRFCDDAFGNVYAMSNTRMWKSAGGTQPWIRIDQAFSSLPNDPSINLLFNSISGDTLLLASTVFGGYRSRDQGATWSRDSLQFPASFMYGLVKTPSGKLFTSTSLGVFAKNSPADDWSKVFPSQGYLAASPVHLDGSGSLYTLGAKINPSNVSSALVNWKSTNGGVAWSPDSLGLAAIGGGQGLLYWVD